MTSIESLVAQRNFQAQILNLALEKYFLFLLSKAAISSEPELLVLHYKWGAHFPSMSEDKTNPAAAKYIAHHPNSHMVRRDKVAYGKSNATIYHLFQEIYFSSDQQLALSIWS